MSEEITKNEIIKVINESTTKTEKRFDDLEIAINDFASHVENRFERVDKRFDGVESRLGKIEATMVTKDYLDDKLGDLRGDLTVLMRKEDTKVKALIEILKEREVITAEDVKKILSMEPFPQNL